MATNGGVLGRGAVTLDLVTVGEALLRLSVPLGRRLEEAASLEVTIGGAELNVAVAVARMGRSAAWLGRLPDSPLGARIARELRAHGVDTSGISWTPEGRVGTYYVEPAAPPRRTEVVYDRAGSVGAEMTAADVDWAMLESARVVHLTGVTPALSDRCRSLAGEVIDRSGRGGAAVVFDVNYRSKLWSADHAAATLAPCATGADVVIVTEEDAAHLFGVEGDAEGVVRELAERLECGRLVLTRGAEGAAWIDRGQVGHAPALATTIVDRIGSGDALAAGIVLGVLEGDLAHGVRLGTAMAALTLGAYGDTFRFGPAEVEQVLGAAGRSIGR